MRQLKAIAIASVLTAAGVVQTHAGTIDTYTDRAAWNAAVGTLDTYTVDFNSYDTDTEFRTGPVDLGPFTMEETGAGSPGDPAFNFFDAVPFDRTGVDGTTLALMVVKTDNATTDKTDVDMTFNAPVFVWGADFVSALSANKLDLVLDAGGAFTTVEVEVNTGFFGFVTSGPKMAIDRIIFQARTDIRSGEVFRIDNVSAALSPAANVPEPSSVVGLLGICVTGLLVLGFVRRRPA